MQFFKPGMAEIMPGPLFRIIIRKRHLLYVLILLFFQMSLFSQVDTRSKSGKKKIEILNADLSIVNSKLNKDLRRLLGNVRIRHNDISMKCDSAYFYEKKNQVEAFSKIHIEQGDTLDLYGDYLLYDGTEEKAYVTGDVELINNETHLYTDVVNYDVNTKTAYYPNKGKITNADNVLTSLLGVYHISRKMFHFKDSVKIVNPDYVMVADTMEYNTETGKAFFFGPSNLTGDSIHIYCESGWYDTKQKISRIWKNAQIDNFRQIVNGDSLYYEEAIGYGRAFGNVTISDTTGNVLIKGERAWYYKSPEKFLVTDSARFVQISKDDTLYLHADTIKANSVIDSKGNSFRLMKAYYDCRIFSSQMQARCDSLIYSFRDSVVKLYHSPIIWAEEYQLTSDSIALFTKNRQIDRMELYNSAFVVSEVDSVSFNQIKGRNLTGYFKDNELYKINIVGNGESIYFLPDGDALAGVNQAKSSSLEIFFENGKVKELYEYQNVEETSDPPLAAHPKTLRLQGFKWFYNQRPLKMQDIFIDR
jgi:lipopolysaccharide assembly outer membrane protein LptD (OstA)